MDNEKDTRESGEVAEEKSAEVNNGAGSLSAQNIEEDKESEGAGSSVDAPEAISETHKNEVDHSPEAISEAHENEVKHTPIEPEAPKATDTPELQVAEIQPTPESTDSSDAQEPSALSADKPEENEDREVKLNAEEDLAEKGQDDDQQDDEDETDYNALSKKELVAAIKKLTQEENIKKIDQVLKVIKPPLDKIQRNEKKAAFDKFIVEGGEKKDFEYRYDELDTRFDANYKLLKDKVRHFYKDIEQRKDQNLKRKEEILESLREFVDSEETNISFDKFKALQNEWKSIGPIPNAYVKTLWANYNAIVDRFYDNRSIYFELKELDRRKNLEAKIELCIRAEKLAEHPNMKEAIQELNELHHEYKYVGPVPKEEQEPLWQRFKAASDKLYDQRKGYVEHLKTELEANLKVKLELAEIAQSYVDFDSDRIKEWNNKTKEIQELQKKWESVGGLPRAKAKDINRKFWGSFKTFFHNKSNFFKKLDGQREENLKKKQVLIQRAVELQESEDWNNTANAYKRMQQEWRDIGPVPDKYRDTIYKEFKAACDHFFEKKRANGQTLDGDYKANLQKKQAICDEIEKMAEAKSDDIESFQGLQQQFDALGFVPRNAINTLRNRYAEVVDKYLNSIEGISNEDRREIKMANQVNQLLHEPNAADKIYRREIDLKRQIGQVEGDITLWKNNLEFFADSKTADKLKDEFNEKIETATLKLDDMRKELSMLRKASQ